MNRKKLLLAGQQNTGKSTIFNMLTGARQHVANYPGVTVDKKVGYFSTDHGSYQLIDLPGTYSLTSFSLEERVARRALREESADVVLNVLDAANITRSLHLTLQLIEMGLPVMLILNMMDVAKNEGIYIDVDKLARHLHVPVVEAVGRTGQGVEDISDKLNHVTAGQFAIDYPELESRIEEIRSQLSRLPLINPPSMRWLSIRLLEGDEEAWKWLEQQLVSLDDCDYLAISRRIKCLKDSVKEELDLEVNDYIVSRRQQIIRQLMEECVTVDDSCASEVQLSDRIDKVVLSRAGAPIFLLLTVFSIYQVAIVWGYELTNYTWPYLAALRDIVSSLLPEAGFLYDPYVRSLGLWVVDSANTLLNYVPIFAILFALIAILEDSGYMARIAFIADKVLSRFGLHGQSTLPMILSGVFAGGCAVPGVMATKGIPDNRARIATILTVPFMNCLAKVPLYTLLLGIFFVDDKPLMMFYISTITIIAALLVAKLLTRTVLRSAETAPFVMELPRYNLPTVRSILTRAVERTWVYIRKVGTVVLAVSTVIFVLLQFPGLSESDKQHYQAEAKKAVVTFQHKISKTEYAHELTEETIPALVNYYTDYKRAKLNAGSAEGSKQVSKAFQQRNERFYSIVVPKTGGKSAKVVYRALRKLASSRSSIRREIRERRLETSLLGMFGRSIEPVTQVAGFDWKINIALFSSFAARESSVATLGVLFQQDEESNKTLEQRMGRSTEFSQKGELAAVALILFFALYPPCLATVMMIKVQTGRYRWMLLSIALPTTLGFMIATAVYSLGHYFELTGVAAMSYTYFSGLTLLLLVGFKGWLKNRLAPDRQIPVKNIY
ncbi:ferrous iron transport protein B [Vibrio albus]|uniref:Ferrous iron transport protein B n=1 Tax=Vibrio albus TaxID=2200953 RepID=A0A2U3BDV0_9VIBR|nr:ferrous iron transport protein B [Vibrio albus]PWI34922.1 ferrous iron transport protein B [Vibrio albus]